MTNQQELANTIKNVHIELRLSSRKLGADAAWEQHCKKSELLKNYAQAMKKLATSHWETNNANDPTMNRIYWVVQECEDFFFTGGAETAVSKEKKLFQKFVGENENFPIPNAPVNRPLKMLDVGSCYNPFRNFDLFDVTAVDIAPASDDVIECDFLRTEIGEVDFLIESTYDVVLFSFLLEYLPEPKMRYACCLKAYKLLKPGGVLVILTPDSKHDTANSKIMKTWRLGLASIGFMRVNYKKLRHLRCMSYYKCRDSRSIRGWLELQKFDGSPEECVVIPQDSNPYDSESAKDEIFRSETDNIQLAVNFADMVNADVFVD
ncbi:Putative methyltransferase (DUF3321) [Nesidiocoris tenuis]|uniref:S-adenosylmethionine sensor upstream of mTORC1 n=1 Tax=Nesidiocoris tenuis TaxID=355587 RepID=A0ABN7B1L6_9HEMI|nr:Putative methyltransferase (DUF3321) [Nesidiocoris tenuis]